MSKFDALRNLMGKVPWLTHDRNFEQPMDFPDPPSRIEEMHGLLMQAGRQFEIQPESGTWMAVSGWAARELLEALSQLEVRDKEMIPELQVRIKVLREVLALENGPEPVVKFDDESRHIP